MDIMSDPGFMKRASKLMMREFQERAGAYRPAEDGLEDEERG